MSACKNIGGQDWEDLRNEVVLKMYELSDERYTNIKNHLAFMIRVAQTTSIDKAKKHSNKYEWVLNNPEWFCNIAEVVTDFDNETDITAKLKKDIDDPKRLYHSRIFVYCNIYGSIKECSRKIGIPYKEVRTTYNDYKLYLKNWLKSHI